MNPRKTMGADPFEEGPLDGLVPRKPEAPENRTEPPKAKREARKPKEKTPKTAPETKTESPKAHKERLTVHLPLEVIDRAKNAVYWTPGLTLAGLAEGAFLEAVERLEKKNGGPFQSRKDKKLKGGRPIK